jgi:hypothetical protein
MRKSASRLFVLVLGLVASTGTTTADDKVVGAIWSLRIKNPKGEWVGGTQFRATLDGKVYFEGKQVGTHARKGDDVEMVLDKKSPRFNGTYTFRKVKRDARLWEGTFKGANGSEARVRLKLVED